MAYTEEVKQKMDSILNAFAEELQDLPDIRYSEETGYVWSRGDGPEAEAPIRIDTPDKLVELLIGGIADAVIHKRLSAPVPRDEDVKLEMKTEIYRRIMEPVKRIEPDRAHYIHLAINYYQDRFERKKDDKEGRH